MRRPRIVLTPVDHHVGAGLDPEFEIRRDFLQVRGGDERAHVGAGGPAAHGQPDDPLRDLADEGIGTGSDRNHGRDRHAPFAGRAEPGVHRGVGREIEVGVGQHDHVVLRAAQCLHTFALVRRGFVDVPRDWMDPTNETAFTVGCSSSRSTATLSPCTTLNTPAGSPASAQSSTIHSQPLDPSRSA